MTRASSKRDDWLTEDGLKQVEMWARDGLSDEQIASNIGTQRSTLWRWRKQFPELEKALKSGRRVVVLEVENALVKAAKGYDVIETEETVTYDADGNETGKICKAKKRHIPPSVGAIVFYLKNRRPDRWKDKPIEATAEAADDDGLVDAINSTAADDWVEADTAENVAV